MTKIQNEGRDSTIIYRSFYEAIIELPEKNQAEVWKAIFEYALNFQQIELTGLSKTIFTLIKPQLDANIQRYKNGKKPKGKQKVSKSEAKNKQVRSETATNVNDNPNPNVNLNLNKKGKEKIIPIDILKNDYLSDKILCNNVIKEFNLKTHLNLANKLSEFNSHLRTRNKLNKSLSDYYEHFANWIRKLPEPDAYSSRSNSGYHIPVTENRAPKRAPKISELD